ncbi:MAG: winged helix DNA-binding domain-containing protein [Acidimicrobiales bacterium]
MVTTIDGDERRARLGDRHHLASPAATVGEVSAALVGLHSSDPVTVYLSSWARVRGFERDQLEKALYDDRSLIRMLGMRRTMFVVPVADAPMLDAACTQALAAGERRRLIALIEGQGIARDGAAWVRKVERKTLAVLEARGEATATQLTSAVAELAGKLVIGEGKKWAGTTGLSTRVLFMLATDARIVRGRPLGSWLSTQYRWVPMDTWLGSPLRAIDAPDARAELVRRWLHTYGPGTLTDIKWWTGWSGATTLAALRAVEALEVRVGDGAAYMLDTDARPARAKRWVALLPSLDPTVMGWKERTWFLGDHQPSLFDRNGNAGPTVWCNGRIVGGWTQRRDGTIAVEFLEKVDSWAADKIAAEAKRLEAWLGDTRITPRFRTPLEQRLGSDR